jgi:hypothetical protein
MQTLEFYFNYEANEEQDLEKFAKGEKTIEDFDPASGMMTRILALALYKGLYQKYPNIKIVPKNTTLINPHCCCPAYGVATLVVKNPENGKYMIISFCDKAYYIGEGNLSGLPESHALYKYQDSWGWKLKDCARVFQAYGVQGEDINYTPAQLPFTYTPCTFSVCHYSAYLEIEKRWRDQKITPEKLFFRGEPTTFFRAYVKDDKRFEIKNARIAPDEFIREMSGNSIAIDINAIAELSCRTMDALGLGCALIRPKLLVEYHNKLIPNYHYAAVDCDDLGDFKKLADSYVAKFEELKSKPELVEFYSRNGRAWYEQNCTIDSYTNIFVNELIDLNEIGITI